MSSKVKVWNDNVHPFSQKFKGQEILIPAKNFIEMDYSAAQQFLGKPSPIKRDGMGQQDPVSYKMLRIEGTPKFENKVNAYKSHVDGSLHLTQEALEAHEMQFAHMAAAKDENKKPAKKSAVG